MGILLNNGVLIRLLSPSTQCYLFDYLNVNDGILKLQAKILGQRKEEGVMMGCGSQSLSGAAVPRQRDGPKADDGPKTRRQFQTFGQIKSSLNMCDDVRNKCFTD